MLNVKQLIIFSTLTFMNKIVQYKLPQSILEIYDITHNKSKYKPKYKPKSKNLKTMLLIGVSKFLIFYLIT